MKDTSESTSKETGGLPGVAGKQGRDCTQTIRNPQQNPLRRAGKGNISLTCSRRVNPKGGKWEKSSCFPQQLCQDKADISCQGHVSLGISRKATGQHPSEPQLCGVPEAKH